MHIVLIFCLGLHSFAHLYYCSASVGLLALLFVICDSFLHLYLYYVTRDGYVTGHPVSRGGHFELNPFLHRKYYCTVLYCTFQ